LGAAGAALLVETLAIALVAGAVAVCVAVVVLTAGADDDVVNAVGWVGAGLQEPMTSAKTTVDVGTPKSRTTARHDLN